MLLAACGPLVPATTPPQLEHTPGAFVVVTDSTFDAGDFQLSYPSSWRVVKTSIAAAEHIQVVFVTPDESTIAVSQVDAAGDTSDDAQYITLDNELIIQVVIDPSEDAEPSFIDQAEQLIASIEATS